MRIYDDDNIANDTIWELAESQAATNKNFNWSLSPDDFTSLLYALQACYGGDNRPFNGQESDDVMRNWARSIIGKFARQFGIMHVTVGEREATEVRASAIDYAVMHNV